MPEKMDHAIQDIVMRAILESRPKQMEIAIGDSETKNRKIRLIALPHNYGHVEDDTLTLKVPNDLGEIIKL